MVMQAMDSDLEASNITRHWIAVSPVFGNHVDRLSGRGRVRAGVVSATALGSAGNSASEDG